MKNFSKWEKEFRAQNLYAFNGETPTDYYG